MACWSTASRLSSSADDAALRRLPQLSTSCSSLCSQPFSCCTTMSRTICHLYIFFVFLFTHGSSTDLQVLCLLIFMPSTYRSKDSKDIYLCFLLLKFFVFVFSLLHSRSFVFFLFSLSYASLDFITFTCNLDQVRQLVICTRACYAIDSPFDLYLKSSRWLLMTPRVELCAVGMFEELALRQ